MFDDISQLDDALVGRILGGKFKLRECVGAGATGAVYLADQTALGRRVAVKILNPALAQDPKLVKRFHDEALAASRLNHPNTVSVIDYGQADDSLLYIVMEFLPGETLHQLLTKEFPLDTERIVDILSQILAGLEEAHHCGVIHADLKADNIVIEHRHNGWDLVKVVDFGIARLIEAPRDEDSKRTICGTPEYMAPEIISGIDPSVASDLYAVGVLLYEMLTSVTPFAGGETLAVLTRHLREQPMPPRERCTERRINPTLEQIALKALSKAPADRFESAADFRDALDLALDDDTGEGQAEIQCEVCNVSVSVSFKFCPECGNELTGVIVNTRSMVTPVSHTSLEYSSTLGGYHSEDEDTGLWPLPLMGREETLYQLLDFVKQPAFGVLQLVGDSGSGRSRLIRDLQQNVRKYDDTRVFHTGADPTGLRATYRPIRALLTQVLSLPAKKSLDTLKSAIESHGLTRRDVPGIAEMFGYHGELWQLTPPVRRREIFAAAARALDAVTRNTRLILLFENVDEYDNPSKQFVHYLAQRDSDLSMRIVVSNGEAYAAVWPENVQRLQLNPLDFDDLLGLAVYLEDMKIETVPTASRLIELTAGHAAHVHHVVRFSAEGQTLENIPTNLADLIAERVRMLPHPARVVCQTAAVFGNEVGRNVLFKALHGRLEASLDAALSYLKSRGLLYENRKLGETSFANQLVRDVIYDATPAEMRRELHVAAAVALEMAGHSSLVVGHHHELAGHLKQAASLLGRAGDNAVKLMDDEGATLLYHRALDCARKVMLRDADRESRSRFVALSVKLAEALRINDQAMLARGVVEEARGYSDGNPALDAQLLQASAHLSLCENKIDAAIETIQRGIGLLIQVGNTELLAEMYLDLSTMHISRKDQETAIGELGEGLNLVTLGEGKNATTGPTILWRLLLRLGQLHAARGDNDEALSLAESALIHARRIRSRIGSARVQATLAKVYDNLGNTGMADQYRAAAVNEMRRLGDRRGTAELILSNVSPSNTIMRINPNDLREARQLAAEVGWSEGVEIAHRKTMDITNT